jgi:hypothetical protein
METLQNLLTIAIEATAVIGISGIFSHALFTSHCKWKATYCPPVAPFQEEAIAQENQPTEPEAVAVVEPEVKPEFKPEVVKVVKASATKKLQPLSVGAAAVDYSVLSSEQLRKECALQSVNWRTGGDYGRPMKKAQMLAALR